MQRDRVEAGEEPPGQVGYGELEDGRPHELGETGHRAGIAWRRGRETEAGLRDRHLEGLIPKTTAEVMDLIDDEEIEAIPELVHVPKCALEGRNRQRRSLAHAVAIAPDGTAVHAADLPNPLIEQNTGRDETQRAQACPEHGGEGEPSLAAPGREGNDAAAVPQLPCG